MRTHNIHFPHFLYPPPKNPENLKNIHNFFFFLTSTKPNCSGNSLTHEISGNLRAQLWGCSWNILEGPWGGCQGAFLSSKEGLKAEKLRRAEEGAFPGSGLAGPRPWHLGSSGRASRVPPPGRVRRGGRRPVPGGRARPPACRLPTASPQGSQQGRPVPVQNVKERGLGPHGRKGHEHRRY